VSYTSSLSFSGRVTSPSPVSGKAERATLTFYSICRCGNATEGSSYCSSECRELDYQKAPTSPEFSPYLSPVPPLISSAKSSCSTPPSSATNSPLQSSQSDLADPPGLDLPPPKDGYGFAHSLPANAAKLASTWSINYQPEPLASPLVAAIDAVNPNKDLSYRRKIDRPHPTVPSPLYFRQKAAAVHSSPALHPVSPSTATKTPFFSLDSTGAHIHDDDITLLSLPQRQADSQSTSTIVPTPSHCGRPGCVGVPKKLRVDTNIERKPRRKSWQPSPPHPFKAFTSIESNSNEEVLVSPRIHTLRTGRSASDEGPSTTTTKSSRRNRQDGSDSDSSGDDAHSAFACYLFSHLADPAKPSTSEQRGRAAETQDAEMQRSRSVDAATAARSAVGSSTPVTFPSTPARPTRTLFKRGPAAQVQSEPVVERLTPLDAEESAVADTPEVEEESSTFTLPSQLRGRQRDDTIRASALPKTLTTRQQRPNLLPGHFIQATTDSPSSSLAISPFASPPATPPTAGRGRSSSSRRFRRSLSPESHSDEEEENDRSRSRSRSARVSRSRGGRGGGGRDEETPRVGRTTRGRAVVDEYDADEDRGRGRGRQSSSRSKSRSSRGRGGAHGSDSDR